MLRKGESRLPLRHYTTLDCDLSLRFVPLAGDRFAMQGIHIRCPRRTQGGRGRLRQPSDRCDIFLAALTGILGDFTGYSQVIHRPIGVALCPTLCICNLRCATLQPDLQFIWRGDDDASDDVPGQATFAPEPTRSPCRSRAHPLRASSTYAGAIGMRRGRRRFGAGIEAG